MRNSITLTLTLATGCLSAASLPNIVVFTVDDMDITSVNCYGNPLPGLTPNMDELAGQGMRFTRAHVSSAICMPCRQSMMTGLHPHRNGSFGFVEVEPDACPSLSGLLIEGGYFTASIGKGRDYKAFPWDLFVGGLGGDGWYSRKPEAFHQEAKKAIEAARRAGKPLYLGINTSDPHRPFPGSDQEKEFVENVREQYPTAPDFPEMEPICSEDEVPLLPYLPDLPDIRKETVQYLTSVRRADETLGSILELIEEEGLAESTLFIFLSDHNAAMPTAKQNCYAHSTLIPLIVRWPGKVGEGSVDDEHMVSTLDLMPTILEAIGLAVPEKQDGRSILPILQGASQEGRDFVFTTHNYIHPGLQVYPMRAIHTKEWSYIFNPWSDGKRKRIGTENQSGLAFAAMREAARKQPLIKERLDQILLRSRDELFHRSVDPYSFDNLASQPGMQERLQQMKARMADAMRESEDPLLESLLKNESYPEAWDGRK